MQTLLMLVGPVLLNWHEQVQGQIQQQKCLAQNHVCDDIGSVFVEVFTFGLIVGSLIAGPWVGGATFSRRKKIDGSPE